MAGQKTHCSTLTQAWSLKRTLGVLVQLLGEHQNRNDFPQNNKKCCNATISAKKFVLAAPDATIVSHKCTSEGRVPHEAKIQKIRDWPECENLMQVRGFLGTCGMLRIFIRNFAAIARPLVRLMRKGIPFEWGEAQRAAMIRLKDEIIQSLALRCLDYESG